MIIEQTPEKPKINDCWNRIGVWGDAECPELQRFIHCRNCPVYSDAAIQLLDSEVPPKYLEEWTAHFTCQKETADPHTQSVVIFRIGGEWLALPTSIFTEVSELKPIHSLPHRRGEIVLGLANIRGELLIGVSLTVLLGLENVTEERKKRPTTCERLLVISQEGHRFVFPVHEVHGIHRFHPRELKEIPSTLVKASSAYTKGILVWNEKSVGCLDTELLFYTLNRSLG